VCRLGASWCPATIVVMVGAEYVRQWSALRWTYVGQYARIVRH
jgi:hypothetical protein